MDEAELKEMASVEESHWWFAERRNLLRKWVGDLSKDAKALKKARGGDLNQKKYSDSVKK